MLQIFEELAVTPDRRGTGMVQRCKAWRVAVRRSREQTAKQRAWPSKWKAIELDDRRRLRLQIAPEIEPDRHTCRFADRLVEGWQLRAQRDNIGICSQGTGPGPQILETGRSDTWAAVEDGV